MVIETLDKTLARLQRRVVPFTDDASPIIVITSWKNKEMYEAVRQVFLGCNYYAVAENKFRYPAKESSRLESSASFKQLHEVFDKGNYS